VIASRYQYTGTALGRREFSTDRLRCQSESPPRVCHSRCTGSPKWALADPAAAEEWRVSCLAVAKTRKPSFHCDLPKIAIDGRYSAAGRRARFALQSLRAASPSVALFHNCGFCLIAKTKLPGHLNIFKIGREFFTGFCKVRSRERNSSRRGCASRSSTTSGAAAATWSEGRNVVGSEFR